MKQNPSMDIVGATHEYEEWLGGFMDLSAVGLEQKHSDMAADILAFLRATYYRWALLFPQTCPELADAPRLLAVGDLHVENFGTWRDLEGRLVWGVNDFDEAAKLSYANDLVRLGLSAKLMLESMEPSQVSWESACEAIVEGYIDTLSDGVENVDQVQPIVLSESYGWLAKIASEQAIDPQEFWNKLSEQANPVTPEGGETACELLRTVLPDGCENLSWKERVAGEGSLGRPRYVGIADWRGAKIAREAKALAPPAARWASASTTNRIRYSKIIKNARRSHDPFLQLARARGETWIIRRLAPDCRKITLEHLTGKIDEKLFHAMGHETAGIHLGQPNRCRTALNHLHGLGPHCDWLHDAVDAMETALRGDFEDWKMYWADTQANAPADAPQTMIHRRTRKK